MVHPSFDRDECIEQAYFFRTFRERLAEQMPAQEILVRLDEEILSTTKLPLAIQFLATEIRHTGLLSSGVARLPHYFTPFQAFMIRQSEDEKRKFTINTALLFLEREATYKAGGPTPAGLFIYHFETIARNKLGYDEGLKASSEDPYFSGDWRDYISLVRMQVGTFDFSDLVYVRSNLYVSDQRRTNPAYEPPVPPLFADKEGKIAKASRGRDPLFLFAALQRQLGYPEVPRALPTEGVWKQIELLQLRLREVETRLRMAESELRGTFDPTLFGKPELLANDHDA